MNKFIDLNADMGEGFGQWAMGNDAELMQIISSANIACGFHAGDPEIMARTLKLACAHQVQIGAHPGFNDLQGFGRRAFPVTPKQAQNLTLYQLGAVHALACAQGAKIHHFKLHGALANMAENDEAIARACYEAAWNFLPDLTIFAIAATAQERACRTLNGHYALEIFADRTYEDDGRLTPRHREGAVISDVNQSIEHTLTMLEKGAIFSRTGKAIPTAIDTICLHGDGEHAINLAKRLREALIQSGWTIRPKPSRSFE